jgi:hypothetical protein
VSTKGILLAWLAGMGIITWRGVRQYKRPVPPGQYLAASGLYGALALLAEFQPAAGVATLLAWGFDLAIVLQVLPQQVAGAKSTTNLNPEGAGRPSTPATG